MGRIEIGTIGLSAMIVEGTDKRTLRRAVGHIPGTALPGQQGNVAIAGHRDTFFRGLRNIHKDDEITLTTLDGAYTYRVDFPQVVQPEDIAVLDHSDEAILTLVTCYPFNFVGPAPERFIVRAHRSPGGVKPDTSGASFDYGEKIRDTILAKSTAKQGQASNHLKGRKVSFISPHRIPRKLEPLYPSMPRERQEHSRRPTVLSSFLAFEP